MKNLESFTLEDGGKFKNGGKIFALLIDKAGKHYRWGKSNSQFILFFTRTVR